MLDSLDKYLDKFEALRADGLALDKLVTRVMIQVRELRVGVAPDEMIALYEARTLLTKPFDSSEVDSEDKRLDAHAGKLEAAITWLEGLSGWITFLSSLKMPHESTWKPEAKKQITGKIEAFAVAEEEMLRATTFEEATKKFAEAVKAYSEIRSLIKTSAPPSHEVRTALEMAKDPKAGVLIADRRRPN